MKCYINYVANVQFIWEVISIYQLAIWKPLHECKKVYPCEWIKQGKRETKRQRFYYPYFEFEVFDAYFLFIKKKKKSIKKLYFKP